MSAHWPTICTLPTQIVRVFLQKVQKPWSLHEWISTIMIFKYLWFFKLLSMISNPKWKSCAWRGILSCRDHHHSEPTPISRLEWTSSHQGTSWGWACSTRFVDEHPPCPSRFFFHLLSALKFSTSPLLPTPSYLPPTNPTPPLTPSPKLQKPRAVVERELERLELELDQVELERDPRAHEKVRCYVFFLFFLFGKGLRSLLLLLPLSLLHCSSAVAQQRRRPSSFSSFLQQKKKAFFFFLFLCCTTAQL